MKGESVTESNWKAPAEKRGVLMQHDTERSYYDSRASKARCLADKANNPAIRQIHIELAIRYELLALGERAPKLSRQTTG